LTEIEFDEIAALDKARETAREKRESQRRLAEELTLLVHGQDALAGAERATQQLFTELAGAEIANLSDSQLDEIFADVPSQTLERTRLDTPGLNIMDALVAAGLAKTKSEARRTVEQGGAYVNNRRIEDFNALLTAADLASETTIVLRSGKKKYALLRFA
jgi:tyrosyl-tRNA synthetase